MIVFNSDLDNTLIYSYKHNIGEYKKCVEIYKNREISFMSNKTIDLLSRISQKICFVPTTTRTEGQYNRIFLPGIKIEYALVCNGGILLKNGKRVDKWYEESLKIIKPYKKELDKAKSIIEEDIYRDFEIRYIDNLFIFTKSIEPLKTVEYVKNNVNTDVLDVFNNGIKIYVIPKNLDKGTALDRFKKYIKSNLIISAGDSIFDISMVSKSDIGFLPESMKSFSNNIGNINFCCKDKLFSEYILQNIMKIIYLYENN